MSRASAFATRLQSTAVLTLLCIAAAAALPAAYVLIGGIYPQHDALHSFEHFSYVYSSLRTNSQIPLWIPYVGFGQTTTFIDLVYLGPPQYFAMALGALLGLRELTAFCLALWAAQVVYLSGLFLLARELRLSIRHSLLLIGCASLLTQPLIQPDWNWGISWPLWIVCWLILRLFRTPDLFYLAILATFSSAYLLFGHLTYPLVVQFYFVAIWFACCVVGAMKGRLEPRPALDGPRPALPLALLRSSRSIWLSVALFGLAAAWVALFLWNVGDVRNNYFVSTQGRDPATGHTAVDTFLFYGGYGGLEKIASIVKGASPTPDFSLFVGKLLLAFAAAGVVLTFRKNPGKDAEPLRKWFVASAVLLILIVLNFITPDFSPVARWSFHLPGMALVRHVAYFGQLIIPLILLLAAIGIEQVAQASARTRLLVIAVAATLSLLMPDRTSVVVAALAIPVLLAGRHFALVAWLAVVVEICAHCGFYGEWELLRPRAAVASFYQSPQQSPSPPLRIYPRDSRLLHDYLRATHPTAWVSRYALEAEYLKEDYCYPSARLDLWLNSVKLLVDAIRPTTRDPPAKAALYGCQMRKIEALRPDFIALSLADAAAAMSSSAAAGRFVTGVVDPEGLLGGHGIAGTVKRISLISFSPDTVRVTVEVADAPALIVYYDAGHPWSRATVDDKRVPIIPANIAFKSVLVPTGVHEVAFTMAAHARLLRWLEFATLASAQLIALWVLSRAVAASAAADPQAAAASDAG